MKKMMLSNNLYFSVQKALIYYTVNKSHQNLFILLVFSHVTDFRYVVNFRFLTLFVLQYEKFFAIFFFIFVTSQGHSYNLLPYFNKKIFSLKFTGYPKILEVIFTFTTHWQYHHLHRDTFYWF